MRVGEFVGEAHPAGETAVEDRTQGNGLGQVGGADAVLQDGGRGEIHIGKRDADLAVDFVDADIAADGGVPALAPAGSVLCAGDYVVAEEVLGG